jgi:hypothetical protein
LVEKGVTPLGKSAARRTECAVFRERATVHRPLV